MRRKFSARSNSGRQIAAVSQRHPGLDVASAYAVTAALRALRTRRGDPAVGRKIGFTNRGIWAEYNISAPMWGDMYASTVHEIPARFALAGLAEPKIEPEIAFRLAKPILPGMSEEDMLGAIEWVAHGFEMVQSIYPAWRFGGADAIAAGGMHGALLLGPRLAVEAGKTTDLARALKSFEVTLCRDGEVIDTGKATNVLGGPLLALAHLADELSRDAFNPPLAAGEIVTTGTLTRAFAVAPGERWTTTLDGIALDGIAVELI